MLSLDSPVWQELNHAYGSARDIPELLHQLPDAPIKAVDYRTQPWFSLWSALCHQSDVYSASYAAVPHIVQIAGGKPPQDRSEFVQFVARIEIYRHRSNAPAIPPAFEGDYFEAIDQMRLLTLECLQARTSDEEELKTLLGSLAVFNAAPKLGNAIMEAGEATYCPTCDAEIPPFGYDLED